MADAASPGQSRTVTAAVRKRVCVRVSRKCARTNIRAPFAPRPGDERREGRGGRRGIAEAVPAATVVTRCLALAAAYIYVLRQRRRGGTCFT